MPKSVIKEILAQAKADKVVFIDLQFTDILGNIKSSMIPIYKLEEALTHGVWIDGSSIEGFARIHESDMYLILDPATYALIPWRYHDSQGTVARFICDVFKPNHEPFEGDPRFILKKALREAKEMGFDYFVGPEIEFFLFPYDEAGKVVPVSTGNGYYFNLMFDNTYFVKKEIIETLKSMGIRAETATYEVAHNQHEIDLHYSDALKIADNVITFKMAAKFIAYKNKYHASFMPKPVYGVNGSGMHTHQSLWKGGKNAFFNPKDPYMLSNTAYQFLAGQLKYVREISGVFAPLVNSYKRLTPGFEAPVYTCWARINRSALIRVPQVSRGIEDRSTRLEIRCPDPSSNPYLTFAVLLKAGLEGIKARLLPPKPIEENLYEFDDQKLAKLYINKLPGSLIEAIAEIQKGTLVKNLAGEEIFHKYLAIKKEEWDSFRISVTDWERERYFESV